MQNIDLVNMVFDEIKNAGFKICNITHPDGYFIMEGDKDSVTHFSLKGHGIWKKWRFGIWANAEYMTEAAIAEMKEKREKGEIKYGEEPKVIQIFAQYETNIDKFKPSRSALCVSYDAEDIQNILDAKFTRPWCQLEGMLRMMCRHPFMCYEEYCGEYVGYYDESFFWNFVKYETRDRIEKAKEKILCNFWYPYTKIKCFLARKDKCIHELKIYNFKKENPGWKTDYLYQVRVTFTEDATNADECRWLDKWFHRNKYGRYNTYDCVVELGLLHKIGRKGAYSYEFEKEK